MVNDVPTPVTFLLALVKVTVPVRFWIQVAAVFQFAAPVTRLVTVAADVFMASRKPTEKMHRYSLRVISSRERVGLLLQKILRVVAM